MSALRPIQKKSHAAVLDAEFDHVRSELRRLTAPGVLGFFSHFELVEVFAVRDDEKVPFNIFSILVVEEHEDEVTTKPEFLGDRIRLRSMKDWMFGISRCRRPIAELATAFENYRRTGEWRASGKPLRVGPLLPVLTQFVAADSTEIVPWNNILKNNFWTGSHVIEWVDPEKAAVQPLFDEPSRLQELSAALQARLPIRLASLSDRLGNLVVQIPVTVLVSNFVKDRNGDAVVSVRWHPKATPRPLRASCAMRFDNVISAYGSDALQSEQLTLPMGEARGELSGALWDDQNQVLVAAIASTGFFDTIGMNTRLIEPEPRVFSVRTEDGSRREIRVGLTTSTLNEIKAAGPDRGKGWTNLRIYRDEAARLAASRRFVQYNAEPGRQEESHERALDDVRLLINQYGEKGACLWDPYLSADDILHTLFYCSHRGADLRALTAGHEYRSGSRTQPTWGSLQRQFVEMVRNWLWPPPPEPDFKERQRAVFTAANSNLLGLQLEYRIRVGSAGWPFHDRFLIFPGLRQRGALAWSLGTSVNSLGKQHHILQQVDDGQLVMDAFNKLWDALDRSEHVVWRIP